MSIFLVQAVLISLTGVMAPGPITAVTIAKGSESKHAGAWIAIGHGVVEFPLMVLIFYGFTQWLKCKGLQIGVGLAGGVLLLLLGLSMFQAVRMDAVRHRYKGSAITAGIVLTGGNPYFFVWWATIGSGLMIRAITYGVVCVVLFMILHWMTDLSWCYFLSNITYGGRRFFGERFQKIVFAICGIFLLFMGVKFILDAIKLL